MALSTEEQAQITRIEARITLVEAKIDKVQAAADLAGCRAERIESKLDGFIVVEAGRYKVDAARYTEFHDTLGKILDELADDPASPLARVV